MLFLWCVLIKKTNTAWQLVHFIQRGMGVWNLSTSAPLTGIELWRGRGTGPHQCHCRPRPVQTSAFVYSSLLGPCHICIKTKPHLQEHWLLQAVEGAETVVFFFSLNFPLKYLSSTPQCSATYHSLHCIQALLCRIWEADPVPRVLSNYEIEGLWHLLSPFPQTRPKPN